MYIPPVCTRLDHYLAWDQALLCCDKRPTTKVAHAIEYLGNRSIFTVELWGNAKRANCCSVSFLTLLSVLLFPLN